MSRHTSDTNRTRNTTLTTPRRPTRRTPETRREVAATLLLALAVPAVLWAVTYPVAAATLVALAFAVLVTAHLLRRSVARADGRRATLRVPGTDLRLEVAVASDANG